VDPIRSATYLSKVEVGTIPVGAYDAIVVLLKNVPIVKGNVLWNCQDWTIGSLAMLKENGYNVQTPTKEELTAKLAKSDRST
ncbi:hypothetical protein BDZ97DRAFT_1661391, partial [Flammula alnicola]